MRNFNENTITGAVLDRIAGSTQPRIKEISEALGFEQLVTHVFVAGDKYLDSDVVFGVKDTLIREFVRKDAGKAPGGRVQKAPYYHLNYDFGLKPDARHASTA
jgi:hypothetical protein